MSAAQDFLDEKLSKNKYTIKQQETLDANGGPSVVNREETEAPAGAAYAKYGKMPSTNKDEGSTPAASTPKAYSGPDKRDDMFAADTDWGRNYRAGIYGGGDYNAQELAEKFGLDNSKEAEAKGGEQNIYGTRADGSSVFLGRASMDLGSNSDLIKAHSKQRHQDEGDHLAEGGNLDSMGDVTGALLASWKDAGANAAATEPEKERTPIEHSPEVKQAKERVANYENDVLSGKMSQDIFEGANDPGNEDVTKQDTTSGLTLNNMDRINDKYSLDIDQGMNGIGTPAGAEPKSTEATQSFLEAKKTDLKKTYGFKPSTAKIQYGVN